MGQVLRPVMNATPLHTVGALWSGRRVDSSGLVDVMFTAACLVPFLFLFDEPIGRLFGVLGLEGKLLPGFVDLSERYEFVLNCKGLKNIFDNLPCKSLMAEKLQVYDFQLFGVLISLFLTLGLLRIAIDAFRLDKLDGVAAEVRNGKLTYLLVGCVLLGPVAMYIVTDFEVASHFGPASRLMIYSPRAFLALTIGLFGGATAFAVEGILILLWLVLRRRHIEAQAVGGKDGQLPT